MKLCMPGAATSLLTLGALGLLALGVVACEEKGGAGDLLVEEPASPLEKTCSRAYGGQDGAREKLLQSLTEEQKAQIPPLPTKEEFVKLCTSLPDEATAKCLDPNWYSVDQKACEELFTKLDEKKTEEIKALFAGKPEEEKKEEAAEGEAKPEGEATE